MSERKNQFCDALGMIPPPSETGSNVIQFELTQGCSHNQCTFCNMYKDSVYSVKSLENFKQHVDTVLYCLPNQSNINRIFIGSGDALSVETQKLMEATQYSLVALKNKNSLTPRRLSIYGNTNNILKHGRHGMKYLRCGGTCYGKCSRNYLDTKIGVDVVYWGLESGCNKVLKITGKGYDQNQAINAGDILNDSDVRASIMVIPGLGGMSYFDQHIKDTATVLNKCKPQWITFMGLQIRNNTPYFDWIEKQNKTNKNRNLSPFEIVEQTAQIIERLNFHTIIGVHGNDVHQGFCVNPVSIGSQEVYSQNDCKQIAKHIRNIQKEKMNLC